MNVWDYFFVFAVVTVLQTLGAPVYDNLRDGEIFNGNNADPERYRWMVWIKRNGGFVCGGTLISKWYVVTAAQCVDRPSMYQVVVGDYDRGSFDGSEEMIQVHNRTLHPNWNRMTLENDIAILRLATPADMNSTSVAKVPRVSNSTIDQLIVDDSSVKCVVTGWGYTTYNGVWMLGPLLQEIDINIINDTRCTEILLGSYNPMTRLCFENADSGTCSGDNGGPWVCRIDTRWTFVGIHSYGVMHDGCRAGGRAGTRVSHYVDWLKTYVMNLNKDDDDNDSVGEGDNSPSE